MSIYRPKAPTGTRVTKRKPIVAAKAGPLEDRRMGRLKQLTGAQIIKICELNDWKNSRGPMTYVATEPGKDVYKRRIYPTMDCYPSPMDMNDPKGSLEAPVNFFNDSWTIQVPFNDELFSYNRDEPTVELWASEKVIKLAEANWKPDAGA